MAEQESGQEKTEQPTPKRLREARDRGQVARSRELTTLLIMLAGSSGLLLMGGSVGEGLQALLRHGLSLSTDRIFAPDAMLEALGLSIRAGMISVAPLLLLFMIVAALGPLALGGWSFSTKAMAFKAEKLDPIKGLGRLFALRGLVEMFKALAKFLLVAAVAVVMLRAYASELLGLSREPVMQGVAHAMSIFGEVFLALSFSLVLVAAIDVPYQLWENGRKLRMTRQEIKDEMKETEGNPEMRGRIRSLQQQRAQSRMMEEVPKADVIITNPTHFAVALRYNARSEIAAPKVIAKGRGEIAAAIRALAIEHEVPMVSAPPLARAIYFTTDLDREIPEGLYLAVAQILAYIYQLQAARRQGAADPAPPQDLDVPEGMLELDPERRQRPH